MKTFKSVLLKTISVCSFVLACKSFTPAMSQPQAHIIQQETDAGDISYKGLDGEMMVFELELHSQLPKETMLRIVDDEHNVLFEERLRQAMGNTLFKISRNDISKLNFEISGKKVFLSRSFSIVSKVEESISVVQL